MRVPLSGIHLGSVVADTVQRIEGYYPGSLSYRLNNPGNLTYAGQPGATPVTSGSHTWASFPTYEQGYQALENQIALDAGRGETIQQFINKYAPASDANNPTSYAAQLATATGLTVNDPLSQALTGASSNAYYDVTTPPDDIPVYDSSVSFGGFDFSLPVLMGGAVVLVAALLFSRR